LKVAGTTLSNIGKGQHFDTLDLAMTVASQGSGVAIGDWALIGEDLSAGRLVMPFDLKVRTGAAYYFVYPNRAGASPQLQELIDWLLAQASAREEAAL
jgi:LysR family glycine cleavage system transcriptional activator